MPDRKAKESEQKMEKIYDIIIVGGGPAGYTAALYSARAGRSVAVIERMTPGGQMALTDVIENYPGFDDGIDGITLGMKMQAGAERYGAVTLYGEVISASLSGEIKELRTADGIIRGRAVVLATGASPRKLGLPDEDEYVGRGIHYCAHCDGRFYKGRTVAVVGGGNSAVGDALYLSGLAEKVYLVHRRTELRADRISALAIERAENVERILPGQLTGFSAKDGHVCSASVTTPEGVRELQVDAVFISIGRVPVTEPFAGELPLDPSGYVIADESTRTPIPGVFAAGDLRKKPLRQIVTAVADGAVAASLAEEYLVGLGC